MKMLFILGLFLTALATGYYLGRWNYYNQQWKRQQKLKLYKTAEKVGLARTLGNGNNGNNGSK
jgi:hypothetical protein